MGVVIKKKARESMDDINGKYPNPLGAVKSFLLYHSCL
jgi:hypothetical protein